MKWCCPGFEGFYGLAGERGAAILVGRDSIRDLECTLQFRAVNYSDELSIDSTGLVSGVVDVRLQYCPWCGRKLDKWYGKYVYAPYRPGFKIT